MNLKNHYYVLRHGYSKANEAGIILSNLEDGCSDEFTLTEEGEKQVRVSVSMARENELIGTDTVIISSPFSHCRRSAEIAKLVLGIEGDIILDDRLRERWFGNFERKTNDNYDNVWESDKTDSSHTLESVESADQVRARTVSLIDDCEKKYKHKDILLVSHGDALQILQTWFYDRKAAEHRSLQHLETAE